MLFAVAEVVDALLSVVRSLHVNEGLERKIWLVGASMGGHAALEFARQFPDLVGGLAVVASYYPEVQIESLAARISSMPMLLVHHRGDRCCPFQSAQRLYDALRKSAEGDGRAQKTRHHEAWFSAGDTHGPSDEELEAITKWILQTTPAA